MKNLVILTGAGISVESGLSTFRGSDGLWCNHKIEDVCTADAIINNRAEVIEFYNERRKGLEDVVPNKAHYALVELEKKFNVHLVTQNVDDLHERAGSHNIIHLHGELRKLRCSENPEHIYDISGWEQRLDERCPIDGSLLRPYIVFFGEDVPNITKAIEVTEKADILFIIGTSLAVYPAASLLYYAPTNCKTFIVDPNTTPVNKIPNMTIFNEPATTGVVKIVDKLLKNE